MGFRRRVVGGHDGAAKQRRHAENVEVVPRNQLAA